MSKLNFKSVSATAGSTTIAKLNAQSGAIGKQGKALNDMIHTHALAIMAFVHGKGAGNRTPATVLVSNIHSRSMKQALVNWFVKYAGCVWNDEKQSFSGTTAKGKAVSFEFNEETFKEANSNPFWKEKVNDATAKVTYLDDQKLIAALYMRLKERLENPAAPSFNKNGDELFDHVSEKTVDGLYKLLNTEQKKIVSEKKEPVNDNQEEVVPVVVTPKAKKQAKAA